jgi:two-component system phosphate regulon sensor histidine kinase PhoR
MPNVMSVNAWRMVAWLAFWLALALAIGVILGHPGAAFVVALAICLSVMLWRMLRFDRWLRRRRSEAPPDYDGVWGDIIAIVVKNSTSNASSNCCANYAA